MFWSVNGFTRTSTCFNFKNLKSAFFFNLTKVQYRIKLKLKDEYFFFKFLLLSVQQEIISGFPLHLLCIGYACTLYVLSGAGDTS